MTPFAFALIALAAYRVTRLIAVDDITYRPRQWVGRRLPPYVDALVTCPWCVGFWVSGALLALAHVLRLVHEPLRFDLIVWWAIAGTQGLLNAVDGRLVE